MTATPTPLTLDQEAPPLHQDASGVIRVGGTRVTLESIVALFDQGASAEEIGLRYDAGPPRHLCDPETIRDGFEQLQLDLAGEINEAMVRTRDILLEHFDEQVLERVRDDSIETRDRFEHLFLDLTRAELNGHATFDADNGFTLHSLPSPSLAGQVPLGRYELPRRAGDAHLYRLGHPLGEYLLEQAKSHALDPARRVLDYDAYPKRLSTLEPWRGSRGVLVAELMTIDSLAGREQRLVTAAITDDGRLLSEDDPEKLLRLPVLSQTALDAAPEPPPVLASDLEQRRNAVAQRINERNLSWFQQEVEKLDAWADDLKVGLEQEIKELDRQIKEVRRTATVAVTLEAKLHWQKQQRELEQRRGRMRRELSERQDEVEQRRDALISNLEAQLSQTVETHPLFVVQWLLA